MHNFSSSVKAIRKASSHLTSEPYFPSQSLFGGTWSGSLSLLISHHQPPHSHPPRDLGKLHSKGLGDFPQKSGTSLRQGYPAIHFPISPRRGVRGEVLPNLLPHLPTAILDNDNLLRTARHRLSRCHHTRERVAAHSRLICSRSGINASRAVQRRKAEGNGIIAIACNLSDASESAYLIIRVEARRRSRGVRRRARAPAHPQALS